MSDISDEECYVSDDSSDCENEDLQKKSFVPLKMNKQPKILFSKDNDDADIRNDRQNESNKQSFSKKNVEVSTKPTSSVIDHPVIQPSSTLWNQNKQRYLVWNYAGSISFTEVHGILSATIRFGNSLGDNLNEQFVCHDDFIFGALSITGACFATNKEFYHHAFIKFQHLSGGNKSFRKTLPSSELICAITMGDGWIAVSTSAQLLRVFTSTGLEIRILCLSGSVICLSGMYTRLAVSVQKHRSKELVTDIFDISYNNSYSVRYVVKDQTLPISTNNTLVWFGFEVDKLTPVMVTSDGQILMLDKLGVGLCGWSWSHVLDWTQVRKTYEDIFYPILFKEQKMSYVKLRGVSKPAIYPTPVQSAISFRYSLTKDSSQKKQDVNTNFLLQALIMDGTLLHNHDLFEEERTLGWMNAMSVSQTEDDFVSMSHRFDKHVLSLLQFACSKQDDALAINFCFVARTERVLRKAILLANHFGRPNVAEIADAILQQKFNCVQESLEVIESDQYEQVNINVEEGESVDVQTKLLYSKCDSPKKASNIIKGEKNPFAVEKQGSRMSMFDAVLAINNPSPVRSIYTYIPFTNLF